MQKIYIVCVGRIKEDFYRAALQEYLKRLTRFAKVELVEIPENKTLEKEGEAILRACKGHTIALCIEGRKESSESFAQNMKRLCDKGEDITFIIGSSCGLAQAVKDRADERMSFSDMTFPHQLMRVILAEQIYRAFMIISGGEYHK